MPSSLSPSNKQVMSGNSCNRDDTYPSKDVISIDDAIERLGMGRFQTRILIAAGLSFAADAMEVLLLSFLAPVLQVEMNLSPNQTATITSIVFAGEMLGTLVLGPLGDIWGRRPVFLSSAASISFFGIATAFTNNYVPLLIARFCVGFGVGGLTVPFDTLAEFLPSSQRGKNLLYIEYFWTVGTLLVPLFAYFTLGGANQESGMGSWQLFCFVCALPCLASNIYGHFTVPESPRWLCEHGKSGEALKILRRAALTNGHSNPELMFPAELEIVADSVDTGTNHHGKFLENYKEATHNSHKNSSATNFSILLSKKWRSLTLKLWGLWLTFAIGYYGTILAISRIFSTSTSYSEGEGQNDQYQNNEDQATGDTYDFNYVSIFQSCMGEVAGLTLVVFTIDRAGRILSQVVSFGCAGICVFLLCFLADPATAARIQVPHGVLVVLAFLARAFEMSATCVTWVSTAELLSTEIRTTGHSAANAVARLGAAVIPFLLVETTPLIEVGIVMLVVNALSMLFCSKLPETKGRAMGANAADELTSTKTSDVVDQEYILNFS
eukprot:CAMPEP_0195303202 /NCGR_PEP_ID=MMETSP0707-20130614/32406_1 /TAXON_ID=33640 /ORGANISM="Asterionellopsis glacialis, Strain CCMP134" /LENGTH=551 /DNA_ID=CAMNT_0040366683 /DNA_START=392 /DNA_END=2047 /DNA_ORIENTATION=+